MTWCDRRRPGQFMWSDGRRSLGTAVEEGTKNAVGSESVCTECLPEGLVGQTTVFGGRAERTPGTEGRRTREK